MKVLMLNGSFNPDGSTNAGLEIMAKTFAEEGVETEIVTVGGKPIADCIACGKCAELKRCVFANDDVNEFAEKAKRADGFVFGSPVYYASANGTLISFLDRLFYAAGAEVFAHKPGAAVVSARRAGTTASLDVLNKYFTISGMPVASSHYWNIIHGAKPGEAAQDAEGVATVRNLAKNMAFLMKSIALGKEAYGLPEYDKRAFTNFIR